VDLPGFNNVVVRAGARQSVVVHADSNLLTRVTTRVRASRLVIGTTPGNLAAKSPMYVVVTLPSVEALILRGAGNITVSNLTLPSVEALILRGRGNITVSNLDSRRLTVGLPGAGTIRATGRAAPLDVTISGSGTALLGQLVAHDVKAGVSGDGSIMLTATHRLDARVSGSGTILYGANPAQIATRVTGGGTIAPG
jgi:putative autotransporter adhesin-like protein